MFRITLLLLLLAMAAGLAAEPLFYPRTQIAEVFCSSGCPGCLDAFAGLDILHAGLNPGEFISTRHYIQSGDLSNPSAEARAAYYGVMSTPTVIFNGINTVNGGGAGIADGSTYQNMLNAKRFAGSPVRIDFSFYNASQSTLGGRVTKLDPAFTLANANLRFLLLENGVSAGTTHVVREIISQPFQLTAQNSFFDFSAYFSVIPPNYQDFWVAAFLQTADHNILQAASTLPQPQFQIRAAMEFLPALVGPANQNYTSPSIWFFNPGEAENFTITLIKDDGPADWYLNFCDDDNCYIGGLPHAFTMQAGAVTEYHLNLGIGSSGISHFRFVVDSDNIEPYVIPFTYQTDDTAADDLLAPGLPQITLQSYPNPFSSVINFHLMAKQPAGPVSINIHDSRGRLVGSAVSGALKAGVNEVFWRAADTQGRFLANGIYFARLAGDNTSAPVKLLKLD